MLRNLTDITVIFGRNGSGKSLLLRAMNEKFDRKEVLYTSPERAGEFIYDQGIATRELDPNNRGSSRRNRNLSPEYRRESLSRIFALISQIGTKAGHGEPVHKDKLLDKVAKSLAMLMPEFQLNITGHPPHFYELWRVSDLENQPSLVNNPSNELSSGETEAITLALDLLTMCNLWNLDNQPQRVLLLDEPDPHLHPELQVRFAKFLVSLIDDYQVQILLATHSTSLLAALGQFGGNRTSILYLNNSKHEQVSSPFSVGLKQIAAVLGGHALIGPLFGAPLLLVEGDDDYQIWSHVPRQPGYRNLLAVIPTDGDQIRTYPAILDDIFGSLRDSSTPTSAYVLFDGDKTPPNHKALRHVACLQLACSRSRKPVSDR